MKKIKVVILCGVFALSLLLSPLSFAMAEDVPEFEPYENVSVGIYENGAMVVSPEYAYNNSYVLSLGDAIWNYYYPLYHDNANFPQNKDVLYDRLNGLFPQGFLNACADNHWLMNAYMDTNNHIILIFSRSPKSIDVTGIFTDTNLNGGIDFKFEPSGVASSVWFASRKYTSSTGKFNLLGYVPYFSFNVSDDNYYQNNTITKSNHLYYDSLETFASALQNDNIRCFEVNFLCGVPSLSVVLQQKNNYNVQYLSYNNANYAYGMGAMFANKSRSTAIQVKESLVSMFPIFYMDAIDPFIVGSYFGDGSVSPSLFQALPQTLANEFVPNSDYDYPIISTYEDIPISPVNSPTPVPTFTPLPTASITLVPTSTPIPPVSAVEGIGQMFTLFTRKYEVNINGANIGIRPLYLFLACFFVGMIFRVFQGGNSE